MAHDLIHAEDLTIALTPWPTRGGQHAGSPPTTLTVTHIPTGVTVSLTQRSQIAAREIAIDAIASIITHPRFR